MRLDANFSARRHSRRARALLDSSHMPAIEIRAKETNRRESKHTMQFMPRSLPGTCLSKHLLA